jgi:MFS family permease
MQTLPLYVMQTFNWSSAGAGLIFVASSIPSFLGVHIGKMIPRLGVRLLATSAFLVASIAWILMRLVTHNTTNDVILLTALLLIEGLAIVTVEVTSTTEASAVVADYEEENPGVFGDKSPVAQAYALFNMAFAGGQLLGPLLAGGMRVHTGWSGMTLILGVVCAVTAVPLGLFSGPRRRRSGEVEGE